MDALSKLCAKLDYHIARARLWKRAAKMWWTYAKDNEQGMIERERLWRDAQALADSRLELLIRAMNALEGWRILLDMPVTDIMKDIEKELSDDNPHS